MLNPSRCVDFSLGWLVCVQQQIPGGVSGAAWGSGEEYLVSRRKGVMFHFAFRLAVTPLGADLTR